MNTDICNKQIKMSIYQKQEKIKNFLNFLIHKYNSPTNIQFSLEPASFRFEENTINMSLIELKNDSIEELLWTIAHEYRHHLQFMGKVNNEFKNHYLTRLFKIKQCKDSIKRNSYSLLLIPIMIGIFKDFPILMLCMNLPIITLFLFFVNKPGIDLYLWLSDESNLKFEKKLEKDADFFANCEVGTGNLVWGRFKDDLDFSESKTQHPSHEERYLESLKFKLNPQIVPFLR